MAVKFINSKNEIYEGEYNDNIDAVRHTASHILAQAVKRKYGESIKLAIGPAVQDGFYYDFDGLNIKQEDLEAIEDEIKKILKENQKTEAFTMSKSEATEYISKTDEPYKLEMVKDLPDDTIVSFFKHGNFIDMCSGPHLLYLNAVGHIKLFSITGAYWRGSEKNKMLSRIYGTCFAKKDELDEYIAKKEEAKKRDHNKIGRELELFTTVEEIGQGLPLLMPKGAKIVQVLQRFIEDEEERRGYLLTKTPFLAKKELYQVSGHWEHYKDGMFILGDEEKDKEIFALRPMTCPYQFMIYKSKLHSYKDLPIRYNETSTLFRNEASGEMHGLIRVRQFTLSEGHLIVRDDQLEDEFKKVLELIHYILDVLKIRDEVTYRFSKWDPNNKEKYIDNPEAWEESQVKMRTILDHLEVDYVEADGEAAFYGPKLDIQYKNVFGKEDTIITIQIDFALPERFDMTYIDKDGNKVRPTIIHRSSIGCYERTLAMLIEKYAGAFPLWLSPTQVKILPITDNQIDYAKKIEEKLKYAGYRVEVDSDNEKIGYKIRQAQLEKIPYMLIIGQKEVDENLVSVRARNGEEIGQVSIEDHINRLDEELKNDLKR